jgi:hypothetical protein
MSRIPWFRECQLLRPKEPAALWLGTGDIKVGAHKAKTSVTDIVAFGEDDGSFTEAFRAPRTGLFHGVG